MVALAAIVLLCLPLFIHGALVDPTPKLMDDIPTTYNPAFCSILEDKNQLGSNGQPVQEIGVSFFSGSLSVKDHVYSINGVNEYLNTDVFTSDMLTDELHWPNEVTQVPDGIFDSRMWAVASGFFLPGKDDGAIALIDVSDKSNTAPVIISSKATGEKWFYHRVVWMDMNKDGHVDAVTARAYGTGAAAEESQLVWFENPGLTYATPSWELHVLHEGTEDIAFRIHDLPLADGTTTPVIISAGFWSFELGLTWSATGDWEDLASIRHMAVDNYGWYFDLQIVDVNMDGRLDVLCTTWSQLGSPGALIAYEIPDDWQNEPWD
uniref:VCBS repeat-containing protein n=1 Tax=Ciona savignyi TaxID=51511 RepID=H2Z740_CIOSA